MPKVIIDDYQNPEVREVGWDEVSLGVVVYAAASGDQEAKQWLAGHLTAAGLVAAAVWNEDDHPRDEHGRFTDTGTGYESDANAPKTGEWGHNAQGERVWRQAHEELVKGALRAWFHSPADMHHLIQQAEDRAPQPATDGLKQRRAEAEALLWEIKNNGRSNDTVLYRGDTETPSGIASWTEDRSIAQTWGEVHRLPAGEGQGIKVSDYITPRLDEKEWLIDTNPEVVGLERHRLTGSGDFDESKHPRVPAGSPGGGRFAGADSGDVESGVSRQADRYADEYGVEPGSSEAMQLAGQLWTSTYEDSAEIQNAADAYVHGDGGMVYPEQHAFAARELIDAMTDPEHPNHWDSMTSEPYGRPYEAAIPAAKDASGNMLLFRGINDPDGSITQKFTEGAEVSFAAAAFTNDRDAATMFAARELTRDETGAVHDIRYENKDHQLILVTSGHTVGTDLSSVFGHPEVVSGGTWKVTKVSDLPANAREYGDPPRTFVIMKQIEPAKRADR